PVGCDGPRARRAAGGVPHPVPLEPGAGEDGARGAAGDRPPRPSGRADHGRSHPVRGASLRGARVLDRPGGGGSRAGAPRGGSADRPPLRGAGAAPRRGHGAAGELGEPAGGGEAPPACRGAATVGDPRRRGLARPPRLRAHRGGGPHRGRRPRDAPTAPARVSRRHAHNLTRGITAVSLRCRCGVDQSRSRPLRHPAAAVAGLRPPAHREPARSDGPQPRGGRDRDVPPGAGPLRGRPRPPHDHRGELAHVPGPPAAASRRSHPSPALRRGARHPDRPHPGEEPLPPAPRDRVGGPARGLRRPGRPRHRADRRVVCAGVRRRRPRRLSGGPAPCGERAPRPRDPRRPPRAPPAGPAADRAGAGARGDGPGPERGGGCPRARTGAALRCRDGLPPSGGAGLPARGVAAAARAAPPLRPARRGRRPRRPARGPPAERARHLRAAGERPGRGDRGRRGGVRTGPGPPARRDPRAPPGLTMGAGRDIRALEELLEREGCRERPLAVLDLDAFDANAEELSRRAGGTPLRVASKSLRVRGLLERVLARPGYIGILAFTLPEALWLVAHGAGDVVVAYPTAERGALRRLATRPEALDAITLMVDETAQLDLVLDAVADLGPRADGRRTRVALELDVSFTPLPGVRFGALRSPLHTPAEAVALAREVLARPGLELVGMMAYEGQIAGVTGAARTPYGAAVRAMKRLSRPGVAARRAEAVAAVREIADLEFV